MNSNPEEKNIMKPTLIIVVAILALASLSTRVAAAERAPESKTLKIVFMLGQSEMVGRGDLSGVGYMLRKPLVPPRPCTASSASPWTRHPTSTGGRCRGGISVSCGDGGNPSATPEAWQA